MNYKQVAASIIASCSLLTLQAQPLINQGLVGVGRLPADSFDQLGAGVDTLGGIYSGLWVDQATVAHSGGTIRATIYGLPDRGFGDGLTDYHPRLQRLEVELTPYYGAGPVAQNQISTTNSATLVFTTLGQTFTGFLPDDLTSTAFPKCLPASVGGGKLSLDAEGIVRATDGSWYVSDEYGPYVFHFNPAGELLGKLPLPEAVLPRPTSTYPRPINYFDDVNANPANASGRFNNRGMEGLGITPDGKRLVACLQSPLAQDGGSRNPSRNVRIFVYDIETGSASYQQLIAEYIHVLPPNAAEANNRHTPVSEILPLTDKKFLILQRDSRGRGGDAGALLYKRIVLADATRAANILGTGYDLEKGAPGQLSLPRVPVTDLTPVASTDLVNLLDGTQLAKFGLNTNSVGQNSNTLSEKWEGMGVIPLNDPDAPGDFLLLAGNDNDFKAATVYHNGVAVGTNAFTVDSMLLAYRIGFDRIAPNITCPAADVVAVAPTGACSAVVTFTVSATDNHQLASLVSTPPSGSTFSKGTNVVNSVATDASGNTNSCTFNVVVLDQEAPAVTGLTASTDTLWPPNQQMVEVNVEAIVTDNCGNVTCEIIGVSSSEPVAGGDDSTSPDWEITDDLTVELRAERVSTRPGRIYTLTVRCSDESGNFVDRNLTVTVPHDQGKKTKGEF